jgi:hypothetical protein
MDVLIKNEILFCTKKMSRPNAMPGLIDSSRKFNVDDDIPRCVEGEVNGEVDDQVDKDPQQIEGEVKDIISKLEEVAQNMKKTEKKILCDFCKKFCKVVRCCGGCFKVKYCTEECQRYDWIKHKYPCKLIQPLRGQPGYNDRLTIGSYLQSILYHHGKRYLSTSQPGAVAFVMYPASKKDFLESKLQNTNTSASWIMDPTGKFAMHYFCLPLVALRSQQGPGGFNLYFNDFCGNPMIYDYFIPVVEMRYITDDKGILEPSSLSYCILSASFVQ